MAVVGDYMAMGMNGGRRRRQQQRQQQRLAAVVGSAESKGRDKEHTGNGEWGGRTDGYGGLDKCLREQEVDHLLSKDW